MKCRAAVCTLLAVLIVPLLSLRAPGQSMEKPRKVVKTDQEWAKLLTRSQFLVTRRKTTEPPFSGKYATSHAKGTYACVCCGAKLFSSKTKFESGTGWPSFWQPLTPKSVDSAMDNSSAEPRVEVMCNDCGAHLGHVFPDGPPPTGLRFCINSLSLKLVPEAKAKPAPKPGNDGKTDPKADQGDEPAPKADQGDDPAAKPNKGDDPAPKPETTP